MQCGRGREDIHQDGVVDVDALMQCGRGREDSIQCGRGREDIHQKKGGPWTRGLMHYC